MKNMLFSIALGFMFAPTIVGIIFGYAWISWWSKVDHGYMVLGVAIGAATLVIGGVILTKVYAS